MSLFIVKNSTINENINHTSLLAWTLLLVVEECLNVEDGLIEALLIEQLLYRVLKFAKIEL